MTCGLTVHDSFVHIFRKTAPEIKSQLAQASVTNQAGLCLSVFVAVKFKLYETFRHKTIASL
jgi:hypothetical protein